MAWLILLVAGLFEVVWAVLLDHTRGFTRPLPSAAFLLALGVSMYLLSAASRSIPIGTAYAIWVGIGAVGTFLFAVVVRQAATSPAQVTAMAALVLSIVALKLTATH